MEREELLGGEWNSPPRQKGVSPWAKSAEFQTTTGKKITPTSFRYVSGEEIKSDAKFLDENGGTWRLTFIDHDAGDKERKYENKFKQFKDDVTHPVNGIKKGVTYMAKCTKDFRGYYHWTFTEIK